MKERLTYLVTSLEGIFRKHYVTTFMTSCKNHIYPQSNFPNDARSKNLQFTRTLMLHILNIDV